ncbi:MAG: DMT family transporter [Salinivirgaceae bacterium]|jgi:transporter family protein|nr:DMT family transporter [Salinivirgaceae bacterium]
MWVFLALISSIFLGIYDITKKVSLNKNAVIPVLFFATLTGAVMVIPLILLSNYGLIPESSIVYVSKITWNLHGLVFLKSALVCTSWIFSYFALKHLPITIITPIRATAPVWTLFGALIIYKEQYSTLQWAGIAIVITFFYIFSLAGNKEGISFKHNKWILFIVIATLLGSISGLYDKYLFATYERMAIQAWFSIYMAVIYLPIVLFLWYPRRKQSTPFQWRWVILLIGFLLTLADFAYFYALTDKNALIAIVSVLRRTSVVLSFTLGAVIFKEANLKRKAIALLGILTGVII